MAGRAGVVKIFRDYDRDALDRQYSPSSLIEDIGFYMRLFEARRQPVGTGRLASDGAVAPQPAALSAAMTSSGSSRRT